jgi:hypothetical protein
VIEDFRRTELVDKVLADNFSNASFENHILVRSVAIKRRFTNVSFAYTTFDGCYFRKCDFDSCDFTGCTFVRSNFRGTNFSGCNFKYASFDKTFISPNILDTECPSFENLKSEFARNLRVNFQSIGDARAATKAIRIELEATREHLFKSWKSREYYYRKKYAGLERLKMFASWFGFKIEEWLWGHGERPLRLLWMIAWILLGLAVLDVFQHRNPALLPDYWLALKDAPAQFLGIYKPEGVSNAFSALVTFVRFVAVAAFISVLTKSASRR